MATDTEREREGRLGAHRLFPIASVQRTRSTLASLSANPRGTNVVRMHANHAIRIAAQRAQDPDVYVLEGDLTANEC